jgi:hypothetical protein
MNFTEKRVPVVVLISFIWFAIIGFAIINQTVLAQTPTAENGSVHVAGITPTPTSPAATVTATPATPATPGTPPPGTHSGVSIPEPTSIALMGLGLASLAGYVKRRRNKK